MAIGRREGLSAERRRRRALSAGPPKRPASRGAFLAAARERGRVALKAFQLAACSRVASVGAVGVVATSVDAACSARLVTEVSRGLASPFASFSGRAPTALRLGPRPSFGGYVLPGRARSRLVGVKAARRRVAEELHRLACVAQDEDAPGYRSEGSAAEDGAGCFDAGRARSEAVHFREPIE